MDENGDVKIKILILGDVAVGKTSFLYQYVEDYFPEGYISTIGVDFKNKIIIKNGATINLQIWDTAGEERFKSITQNYMKGADGILYVYDITQKSSFVNIKTWIKESEEITEGFQKLIVGNKIDLEKERKVTKETLYKFCKSKK